MNIKEIKRLKEIYNYISDNHYTILTVKTDGVLVKGNHYTVKLSEDDFKFIESFIDAKVEETIVYKSGIKHTSFKNTLPGIVTIITDKNVYKHIMLGFSKEEADVNAYLLLKPLFSALQAENFKKIPYKDYMSWIDNVNEGSE